MDKERFLQSGLLEQYVLGLTTEEEDEEVERYAQTFPEIRSEINLLRNAVRQYAEEQIGAPKINNNVHVLNSLPEMSDDDSSPTPPGSGVMVNQWIMAACLVLFAIFGFYYFSQANRSQQEVSQLNRNFVAFKNDCQEDQQILQDLQQRVAFYQHPRTYPVQLKGTALAPESKVRVYWNEEEQKAMLQVFSLPELPQKEQYQIWADIDGKMVALGLIEADNPHPQMIRCLPQAGSLNITREPLGGSEEPHVDQMYANVNLP